MPIKLAGSRRTRRRASSSRPSMSASSTSPITRRRTPTTIISGSASSRPRVRDLYGQLIDGMQGTKGQIRTGGDSGEGELQGSPPTQPPLAFYSGIVTVGPDGTAEVNFDIPAFSGTVRVMAVAWSKDKTGHASGDVVVRDPVVVTATLPRFLLMGDKSTLRLDLDNVEGATGDYQDRRHHRRTVERRRRRPDACTRRQEARGGDASPSRRPASARHWSRSPSVARKASRCRAQYPLSVRPATQILARRTVKPLDPGQSITVSGDVFADLVPGTGKVALSVTPTAALDVATPARRARPLSARLHRADREPRIAAALCQRAVARCAARGRYRRRRADRQGDRDRAGAPGLGRRVRPVVARRRRCLARFLCDGFPHPGSGTRLLGVRTISSSSRSNRLRNYVSTAPDVATDGGLALSYALYVLARNGMAPVGDLRYIADVKLDDLATPTAKAEIARRARHARRPRQGREGVRGGARRAAQGYDDTRAAASITARRCATPRRWSRSPPKATRPS